MIVEKDIELLKQIFGEVEILEEMNNTSQSFFYINNPDGTIRWIVPADQKQPYFLYLYNGSGWRGFLINNFYKIGFKLGLKKWICNGTFEVTGEIKMPKDSYAIFTGTKGENRKVIITNGEPNRPDGYLKIPLTTKARRLTETEGAVLKALEKYDFKTLEIPKSRFEKKGVWVSNVQPKKYKNETEISTTHLNGLMDLHINTGEQQTIVDLPAWKGIQSDLSNLSASNIQNDLSPSKAQELIGLLCQLKKEFTGAELLTTYQAHGDFTPWNMFIDSNNEKLHLFDWELSERLPALYDLFHFVFQTGVLVKKQSYNEIKATIDKILDQPNFQQFIKAYNIDVEQVYRFYLLHNCSYYLKRYLSQKDLHMQAHWLVDCWLEAVGETTTSMTILIDN